MFKLKKSHDGPAILVMALITLMTFSLFGYLFLKMDTAPQPAKNVEKTQTSRVQSTKTLLDGSKVKIESDGSSKNFVIWNDLVRAGEIKEEVVSSVRLFRQINDSMYLGVEKEGVQDSVFGGPQEVYKLDLGDNSLGKVFDRDAFSTDISADESKLVSIERFYRDDIFYNYLNVYDLATMQSQSFEVSKECSSAGNAYFSADGKKVAYEVAIGEGKKVTYRLYVVDLESGKQEKLGGVIQLGQAKAWAESN
jgi:hypothetical protein